MTLLERLRPTQVPPGTLTTIAHRERVRRRLQRRLGRVPVWVGLALDGQLRPGATLGGAR